MRLLFACFLAILCGAVAGSVAGSVFLTFALGQNILNLDVLLHFKSVINESFTDQPYLTANLIVAGFVGLFLVIAIVTVLWDRLVRYGERHFQSKPELRRNGMLSDVGYGFVLGEQIEPPVQRPDRPVIVRKTPKLLRRFKKLQYISGPFDKVMNVLMVAPTRAGKGVGFVTPNALTFPGSMVVLDVKGEIWDETSRARAQQGDKVFRFAPLDFQNPSHQYNPLARLSDIEDMEELWTALERVAGLFLQSERNADWLVGGKKLFVAAGVLAIQRGVPTLGEIYRILFGTGQGDQLGKSPADLLDAASRECQYPPAARELSTKAGLDPKIQQSYLSVLDTAGLAQWSNPKIERVTQRSDFDFKEMRRTPSSVYLVVPSDDLEGLQSLIRLFFADLISFLRSSKPGDDEPWPIFILLDEFDQLGHMPLVVQAMKQTAGHGGRFAIVTQSVPGLLSIPYTPEEVKAIESACQVKLYIAASEDQTASELETALGTRTGSTVSRTHDVKSLGFGAGSVTRSTEHRPLLSKQEIRDMDPDKIIILPERQNPVLGDRIKYYESKEIARIHAAQDGSEFPFPPKDEDEVSLTMTQMRTAAAKQKDVEEEQEKQREDTMTVDRKPKTDGGLRKRERTKAKSKPSGDLSPAAQAALQDCAKDINERMGGGASPVAAQ